MTTNNDWSGVPAGYERIGFRVPVNGEDYVGVDGKVITCCGSQRYPRLIVRKLPPRLVPLEKSDIIPGTAISFDGGKTWAMVDVEANGLAWGMTFYTFIALKESGATILRPGSTEWQPCSKPEGAVS